MENVDHPPNSREIGAEAYPYDPTLRIETQRGLNRLRCFADRALAANLYAVFAVAEHNTEAELEEKHQQERRLTASRATARAAGERALNGMFGPDAKELAEHLLLDRNGQLLAGEHLLDEFARALAKLRWLQRSSR